MTTSRKLGRRPPHPRDTHPRLSLAPFLRLDRLPPVPPVIDWISAVPDWQMYLNDQLGCCTVAAAGHALEAWTLYGQGAAVEILDSDVLAAYEAVSGYIPGQPETDQGAVMQDVLGYWRHTGIGGHRILAFAEVDVHRPDEIAAALSLFGHLYVGVNLPNAALDQFDTARPWSAVDDDGGIAGGHAVDLGYSEATTGNTTPALKVVTWGRVQPVTWQWWQRYAEECWAVVTPEWLGSVGRSPAGLDLYGLGEALAILTGGQNPFPSPEPPTPIPPPPAPVHDPADLALVAAIDTWAHGHHRGETRHVAQSYLQWKREKGL